MSIVDSYRQKLEAQLREQKAQIDALKAKAQSAVHQAKTKGHEELAAADKHFDHIKSKFSDVKDAGGQALSEVMKGLKQAFDDLKASTQKAAHHFNTPATTPFSTRQAPAPSRPKTTTLRAVVPNKKTAAKSGKPASSGSTANKKKGTMKAKAKTSTKSSKSVKSKKPAAKKPAKKTVKSKKS